MQRNLSLLFAFLFLAPIPCGASGGESPIVLESADGTCTSKTEICGDGIDQDCNGIDTLCRGADADRDGFDAALDCDDTNRRIFPGVAVECKASSGTGTKNCQTGGTFTACVAGPLCEAVGSGKCYYISALTGSDSNAGTFNSPWKSYRNIASYADAGSRPAKWKALAAGDVVYFMSGIYSDRVDYGTEKHALYLRSVNGAAGAPIVLKAYPGSHPVFAPNDQVWAISIFNSNWIMIDGLEVWRAYGAGIGFAECSNIELRNNRIHDVYGPDNDNIAGLYLVGVTDLRAHHNFIYDNYDRTCEDTGGNKTQNSRNVVIFSGGNIRLDHNIVFQTQPIAAQRTGGCITYKHSATVSGSIFEVDHNMLWNCYHTAIGSGSFGSRIHHNLILDSDPIRLADFGGNTHNEDNIIEFNTIIGGTALSYDPTLNWGPIGMMTFRKNIVVDRGTYHNERGVVTIHVYGSDTLYSATVSAGKLAFSSNCYYNPSSTMQWNLFNRNGGQFGIQGATYSFSGWKGIGYDTNSSVVDPVLDSHYVPGASQCSSYGWLAS